MGQVFDAMYNFFQEEDLQFIQGDNKPVLSLSISGENGTWRCLAVADDEDEYFSFYSICPVNAPDNKRLVIAEFITRANNDLRLGNFELDFEDGKISYKTSVNLKGYHLKSAMFEHLVYTNIGIMDIYLPGIMRVIYAGVSPEQALAEIEDEEEEEEEDS